MITVDRLEAMTTFVAVADRRSFAAAARQLGISASAVTRIVAALEAHLGIRLLQRTTRSVTLTDAGARYLDSARSILSALSDAESSARAESIVPTGRLVVAAPLVFGRREVAPLLSTFLARYPDVTAELTLADRFVNLLEEGVDVAVRIGLLADSSLRVRVVGRTRRVLVASPYYLNHTPRFGVRRTLQRTPSSRRPRSRPSQNGRLAYRKRACRFARRS
jgi:DNA-binding transcriptional LysR family regulator